MVKGARIGRISNERFLLIHYIKNPFLIAVLFQEQCLPWPNDPLEPAVLTNVLMHAGVPIEMFYANH